jgi:hypothetical protein
MATATKTKPAAAEPAAPITFAEINARKVRERLEAYRDIITRRATGQAVTVADMEAAAELLEHLGLPQYTFERDVQAMQRATMAADKLKAAQEVVPANVKLAEELAAEVEATTKKLQSLREQLQVANAKRNKPTAYTQTLAQLAAEHPHVLADLDVAVRLRIEELDRRKRIGGAA